MEYVKNTEECWNSTAVYWNVIVTDMNDNVQMAEHEL